MQQFRNILVGVDLSRADRLVASELNPPTQEAVNRALWLARLNRAELTFCAALDVSPQTQEFLRGDYEQLVGMIETEGNRVLGELVERATQDGVAAKSRLVFGRGWEELTREVLREKHDLAIVGTRDLSGPARLLLGSTAIRLLRYCPCPVWVTKPGSSWEDEATILVASDFSDVSQRALHLAVNGGQMTSARMHLLHVLEDGYGRWMRLTGMTEHFQKWKEEQRADAEARLFDQLAQTDHRTLTWGVQVHVKEGPADAVILQAVEEYGVDLLVTGTAARSGLPGLLIGNTAERILAHVPCSVVAVKPADFVSPITLDSE